MMDYKLLEALAEVVRLASFERAARALALTPSAVSQRVKLLEQRVGMPLLNRTSPLQATERGLQLLAHVQQVKLLEQALQQKLTQGDTVGYLQVVLAVNADSLATWLLAPLARLFEERRLLVELVVDDQAVTRERLRRGEVVACISSQAEPVQGCRSEFLGSMDYMAVASPAFSRRFFPAGVSRQALLEAPAIIFGRDDELHNGWLQQGFDIGPGDYPAHLLPSANAFVDATLQGMAYALIPRLQAMPHLVSGTLVDLAPARPLSVPLYWHYWSMGGELLEWIRQALHRAAGKDLCAERPA